MTRLAMRDLIEYDRLYTFTMCCVVAAAGIARKLAAEHRLPEQAVRNHITVLIHACRATPL